MYLNMDVRQFQAKSAKLSKIALLLYAIFKNIVMQMRKGICEKGCSVGHMAMLRLIY